MKCPCNSNIELDSCCNKFISGNQQPETAEELMRSRYTAYTLGNIKYIKNTLDPEAQDSFDEEGSRHWAQNSEWKGLKIISTQSGTKDDTTGVVEFIASYGQNGKVINHHEISSFKKGHNGQWYFIDGEHVHNKPQTIKRDAPKIGRNDPCSCGSGKKFKKCCGQLS